MLDATHREQLLALVTRLLAAHAEIAVCAAAIQKILTEIAGDAATTDGLDPPLVDMETSSVRWHGRTCRLSGRIRFRFFVRLARRPNHYVTYHQLCQDVWEGHRRTRDTVRSTVRLIKRDLCAAEMADLAAGIHGDDQKYILQLPTTES